MKLNNECLNIASGENNYLQSITCLQIYENYFTKILEPQIYFILLLILFHEKVKIWYSYVLSKCCCHHNIDASYTSEINYDRLICIKGGCGIN